MLRGEEGVQATNNVHNLMSKIRKEMCGVPNCFPSTRGRFHLRVSIGTMRGICRIVTIPPPLLLTFSPSLSIHVLTTVFANKIEIRSSIFECCRALRFCHNLLCFWGFLVHFLTSSGKLRLRQWRDELRCIWSSWQFLAKKQHLLDWEHVKRIFYCYCFFCGIDVNEKVIANLWALQLLHRTNSRILPGFVLYHSANNLWELDSQKSEVLSFF